MEKLAADLKKTMPFKDTTEPGDIVLIAAREPEMLVYALVGEILRDETRKDEWWHVNLHILTVPPQTVVWTLRTAQFTGREIFTMAGEARFVKAVEFAGQRLHPQPPLPEGQDRGAGRKSSLRVVK